MVERAAAATPAQITALHGRVTLRDPRRSATGSRCAARGATRPGRPQRRRGAAEVDGVAFRRGGHVRLRPGPDADLHARLLDGREATIERIFVDYDGRVHLGVTVDGDPGQELMRETEPAPVLLRPRGGGDRPVTERETRILVAGIGNAWLRDDGFGGEVARRLAALDCRRGRRDGRRHRRPRPGVRGDARLRRAGHRRRQPPGRRAGDALRDGARRGRRSTAGSRTARRSTRTAMDPQTVLRFVKSIGAWPGRVMVIACEPAEVEELGFGLTEPVNERGRAGDRRSSRRRSASCVRPPSRGDAELHELSPERRDREHRRQARGRAARDRRQPARRPAAAGRAGHARLLLRVRRPRHAVRGRAAGEEVVDAAPALQRVRARVGDRDPGVPLPGLRRVGRRGGGGKRVRGRVDRGGGGRHASHTR